MALALAGCGSDPTTPAKPQQPLDEAAQMARQERCMVRHRHYSSMGVIEHGGARPGVSQSAWEKLSDTEKDEVFAVAACIGAGGQVGERIVTIVASGSEAEIETRRMPNTADSFK